MKWINIEVKTLRSAEYISADPEQRATWLTLLGYCCEQENGGIIENAENLSERFWTLLGITRKEALNVCSLWTIRNSTIYVWDYPHKKVLEVQQRRDAGRAGGLKRADNVKNKEVEEKQETPAPSSASSTFQGVLKHSFNGIGIGIGIGREKRNEKENKNENKNKKEKDKKENEIKFRIGRIFRRRENSQWSQAELKSLQAIDNVEENLEIIEKFYALTEMKTQPLYRRTALGTLLNNWQSEADKARNYFDSNGTGIVRPNEFAEPILDLNQF